MPDTIYDAYASGAGSGAKLEGSNLAVTDCHLGTQVLVRCDLESELTRVTRDLAVSTEREKNLLRKIDEMNLTSSSSNAVDIIGELKANLLNKDAELLKIESRYTDVKFLNDRLKLKNQELRYRIFDLEKQNRQFKNQIRKFV